MVESLHWSPASLCEHSLQNLIRSVQNDQSISWQCSYEMVKLALNLCKFGEYVCMIKLKVAQDLGLWPVVQELRPLVEEGCVVLVGFNDEVCRPPQSGRLAQLSRNPPDQIPGFLGCSPLKDPGEHAGSRRLAVGSSNSEHPLIKQNLLSQPLRSGDIPIATLEDGFHERVTAPNHVANHPEVRRKADLFRPIALDQIDAHRPKLIAHRRVRCCVAAGDLVSSLPRNGCDPAHECPANSKNVEVHWRRDRKRRRLYASACAMIRPFQLGRANVARAASRGGMRARIAAAAARIMAEDGIDDFALAKRKAARVCGVADSPALPRNDEIEAALRTYRQLYQAETHATRLAQFRRAALQAMRALQAFRPYLTGPVLSGLAGPHAGVDLQLFPDNGKDVELYLIERGLPFAPHAARHFAGDRMHPAHVLKLDWNGIEFRLSVFDARDERFALKSSVAGRVAERAGVREVEALVNAEDAAATT